MMQTLWTYLQSLLDLSVDPGDAEVRAVRSPVPVTATRSDPDPFTEPAIAFAPGRFFTGADSPVRIDSARAAIDTSSVRAASVSPRSGSAW